jgi:BirA family biotin operon repressor/biotin-[acetyl-CoA-carboxylase] ligase
LSYQLSLAALKQKYRLFELPEAHSTNNDALAFLKFDAELPVWVVTDNQTKGRGRLGRTWLSEAGNLTCSLGFKAKAPSFKLMQLAFVAGVALREAIGRDDIKVKWSNDLLLNGKKLSGILVEGSTTGDTTLLVVGIGVNVLSAPEGFASLENTITSEALFTKLTESWVKIYALWNNGEGFAEILKLYIPHLYGKDGLIEYKNGDSIITGRFKTITDSGALVLEVDGKLQEFIAGEIIRFL